MPKRTLAQWRADFWQRIEIRGPDDCWLWQGRSLIDGYGYLAGPDGTRALAHRLAWADKNGPIPDGKHILHSCENRYPPGDHTHRRCCNDAHLYPGTEQENTADMLRNSRQAKGDRSWAHAYADKMPRGERHGRANLTESIVIEILTDYADGSTVGNIARRRTIPYQTVKDVVTRDTWRHVVFPVVPTVPNSAD